MEMIAERTVVEEVIEETDMGKVMASVELVSMEDETLVRKGYLKKELIRRVTISALVDTDQTLLSLPEDVIAKLGLPVMREAVFRFANGQKAVRKVYGSLRINVMGRTFECPAVAGHPGMPALLGQIPLEGLDLLLDSKRQRLISGHDEHPNEPMYESY